MKSNNLILDLSFDLAVEIVKLSRMICEDKRNLALGNQLLNSGTSIGANVHEGSNAQSKSDFIHKFSIAQKECGETIYWIRLFKATDIIEKDHVIQEQAQSVMNVIRSILISSKRNAKY